MKRGNNQLLTQVNQNARKIIQIRLAALLFRKNCYGQWFNFD